MKLNNPNLTMEGTYGSRVSYGRLSSTQRVEKINSPVLKGLATLCSERTLKMLLPSIETLPLIPKFEELFISNPQTKLLLIETTYTDSHLNYSGLQRRKNFENIVRPILRLAEENNVPAILLCPHDIHSAPDFSDWYSSFKFIFCTDNETALYVKGLPGVNEETVKFIGTLIQPFYAITGFKSGVIDGILLEGISEFIENRASYKEKTSKIIDQLTIAEGRFSLFSSHIARLPKDVQESFIGTFSESQFQMCLGAYTRLLHLDTDLSSHHRIRENKALMEITNGTVVGISKTQNKALIPTLKPLSSKATSNSMIDGVSSTFKVNSYENFLLDVSKTLNVKLTNKKAVAYICCASSINRSLKTTGRNSLLAAISPSNLYMEFFDEESENALISAETGQAYSIGDFADQMLKICVFTEDMTHEDIKCIDQECQLFEGVDILLYTKSSDVYEGQLISITEDIVLPNIQAAYVRSDILHDLDTTYNAIDLYALINYMKTTAEVKVGRFIK